MDVNSLPAIEGESFLRKDLSFLKLVQLGERTAVLPRRRMVGMVRTHLLRPRIAADARQGTAEFILSPDYAKTWNLPPEA
jgi:hypothetical protein